MGGDFWLILFRKVYIFILYISLLYETTGACGIIFTVNQKGM